MAHWEQRDEPGWKKFEFNQPYAGGLKRLKEEILAKTDYDPATLWQWGTMQAMAVLQILKDCEATFGAEGQRLVYGALHKVGYDIGRQIVEGTAIPEGMADTEYFSFFATVVNRIAYASLEDPHIEEDGRASFDILWCPHQEMYQAFDCRVQRYFVQGMIDALRDHIEGMGFQVRFDATIPAGSNTCHFTLWRGEDGQDEEWAKYTAQLNAKAIEIAKRTAEES